MFTSSCLINNLKYTASTVYTTGKLSDNFQDHVFSNCNITITDSVNNLSESFKP